MNTTNKLPETREVKAARGELYAAMAAERDCNLANKAALAAYRRAVKRTSAAQRTLLTMLEERGEV